MVKQIKVDGFKSVILEPKPTKKELKAKLDWSLYKAKMNFYDWKGQGRK